MSDSLGGKALRQPFRFGLMLGALALPTGWTISQDALSLIASKSLLHADEVTGLFALGFLPGMILGAGAVRAWAAWRNDDLGAARWFLIGHGAFVIFGCLALVLSLFPDLPTESLQNWRDTLLLLYWAFPLQCALAMLLLGIFMRSRRA